jgi:predicted GH43/DUF377 family glycosyl hydrolase
MLSMNKKLIMDGTAIQPTNSQLQVLGIFNPAVIDFQDGIIMIARVAEQAIQDEDEFFKVPIFHPSHGIKVMKISKNDPAYDFKDARVIKNGKTSYLTSISHLRIGKSIDGVHFDFDSFAPLIPQNQYEEYGLEDPRITKINDDYMITYTAVSRFGITVRLLKTRDFIEYIDLGNIFHSDNKDCVIFPTPVNGKYFALHRPSISQFGQPDIWTAQSDNLTEWGNHQIMEQARVSYMSCSRVGAGAVPFLTEEGWIVIYHCADEYNRYHLACLLLDKNNPNHVLKRSKSPLIEPTESYETKGFMNDVVFTCGLIQNKQDISIYYGACDERIAMCTLTVKEIYDNLEVVL